jgi:hypothetical protein
MAVDTLDKQLAALRDGDQTIADALATLETKLEAWLSAMRDGQASIAAALKEVDGLENSEVTADLHAAPPSTPAEEPSAPAEEPPIVQDAPDRVPESQPEATAERSHGLFQTPVRAGPVTEADAHELEPEDQAVEQAPPEDDEALLAELDEETATLIRVKRRLSNNTRSVRELLDEMRTERDPGRGKPQQRTRWWRRPNERQSD